MHAEVAVVGRAVEAQINAKGDRGPGGVVLAAVEAGLYGNREQGHLGFERLFIRLRPYLVGLLGLQLLKDLERLLLRRKTTHLGD